MDGAITGGDGHAGFLVDVRGKDGSIVGVMAIDYYAAGYLGETPGTDGSSDGGNPLTGSTGRIKVDYTPDTTVQKRMGTNNPGAIIKGDAAADRLVADYVKDVTNNFINFDEIAAKDEPYEDRENAYGDYETYYVWDENCYNFADKLLSLEAGTQFGDSSTWEGLQSDLRSAQQWIKAHLKFKMFADSFKVFSSTEIKATQQ